MGANERGGRQGGIGVNQTFDRRAKTGEPELSRKKRRTREQLIEAAIAVVSENGASGLTVSQTADLAGVTRRTAYDHFSGKEDLLRAVDGRIEERLIRLVREIPPVSELAEIPLGGRLPKQWEARLALVAEHEDLLRAVMNQLLEGNIFENAYWRQLKSFYQAARNEGSVHKELDPDIMAAFGIVGIWMVPLILMSAEPDKDKRRRLVWRYYRNFRRLMYRGVFVPKAES